MVISAKSILPLAAAVAAVAATVSAPAVAQPYGPDTCIQGYVWREARTGDTVCVTPDIRSQVAAQNANPNANKEPDGGAYGPDTCKQGFVWREAFDGDTICVTPAFRQQMLDANAAAESRKVTNSPQPTPTANPSPTPAAGHTVVFEITGSGTVYSIDTDPGGRQAGENTAVPWKKSTNVGPDINLLQVVAVTKTGDQGCRITVDGTVMVDQAPGSSAHCAFNIQ